MNTQFPTSHHITSHHITSHHITSHHIATTSVVFLGRHRSFLAVLAVFDGCWSLFGSIFAKNVRFSLVFTRDSWLPGTLHRFYCFRRFRRQARQNRPRVPRAGEQDDGSLPHTPSNEEHVFSILGLSLRHSQAVRLVNVMWQMMISYG